MPSFEYGRIWSDPYHGMVEWLPTGTAEHDPARIMLRLNELGREGWEVVGYGMPPNGDQVLYLKRALGD